jgi:dTDP-4-amino-4,6-dideoxygalactose transaminase
MPVHWAGRPCELDKIYSIAKKYKLHVIQDSAHVIGARFKKKTFNKF